MPSLLSLSSFSCLDKNDESFRFLARANNTSEWLWDLYFKFIFGGFQIFIATASIASVLLCLLWNDQFDVTLVYHPYRFVLVNWMIIDKILLNWTLAQWQWKKQNLLTLITFNNSPSLPWDQTTLLGYFGEIIFCILVCEAYLLYNGAVLLTFVSICLHHKAFSGMFQHKLRNLEGPTKNRSEKDFFHNIIDLHNTVKRWTN